MRDITKEQAKRLHKAGYPAKDAKWHWVFFKDDVENKLRCELLRRPFGDRMIIEHYPAPSEKEMIKRLGNNLKEILCPYIPRRKSCNRPDYGIIMWHDNGVVSHSNLTEALVRAVESVDKAKGKRKWKTEENRLIKLLN